MQIDQGQKQRERRSIERGWLLGALGPKFFLLSRCCSPWSICVFVFSLKCRFSKNKDHETNSKRGSRAYWLPWFVARGHDCPDCPDYQGNQCLLGGILSCPAITVCLSNIDWLSYMAYLTYIRKWLVSKETFVNLLQQHPQSKHSHSLRPHFTNKSANCKEACKSLPKVQHFAI